MSDLAETVAGYLAGTLSLAEREAFALQLRADSALLDAVAGQVSCARQVRALIAGAPAPQVAQRVQHLLRMRRTSRRQRVAQSVVRRVRRRRASRWPLLMVTGLAATLAAIVLWPAPTVAVDGLHVVEAATTAQVDGRPLRVGSLVQPTERLTGAITLADGSGTRIELDGTARVGEQVALELASGAVYCAVAPRPAQAPFVVTTPHGSVTVLGTRFHVRAGAITEIDVDTGRVRMAGHDGIGLELAAGESGEILAQGPLRLVPLVVENLRGGVGTLRLEHAERSEPTPDGYQLQPPRGKRSTDGWSEFAALVAEPVLTAPVRIEVEVTIEQSDEDGIASVELRRADGSHVWFGIRGVNRIIAGSGESQRLATATRALGDGSTHRWHFDIDGESVRWSADGAEILTVPVDLMSGFHLAIGANDKGGGDLQVRVARLRVLRPEHR